MAKYRKKPVVIEATQLTCNNNCFKAVLDFTRNQGKFVFGKFSDELVRFVIPTPEGDMVAKVGDYIIKGVNGEFYPCKPDIFEKTYEKLRMSNCKI